MKHIINKNLIMTALMACSLPAYAEICLNGVQLASIKDSSPSIDKNDEALSETDLK